MEAESSEARFFDSVSVLLEVTSRVAVFEPALGSRPGVAASSGYMGRHNNVDQ